MQNDPPAPTLLRAWREAERLSQGEAAKKVGVHQNSWSDWESGRKAPRTWMALMLEVLTRGKVPLRAWLKRAERKRLEEIEEALAA